jgi:hypothetical protein
MAIVLLVCPIGLLLRYEVVNPMGAVELSPPPSALKRGSKVRIVRGPLSGLEGLVDGLKPRQRIEILLRVLGRVALPEADVEATD